MRAFITGITGMAGSYLAEHLLELGDEVVGCSRRGVWPKHIPAQLCSGVDLFAWDISAGLQAETLRQARDFEPDWIFHLAALSVPADCGWQQPTPVARATNVDGLAAVIELAEKLPNSPRIVLASSCHVYAPVSDEQPVVDEGAPLGPVGGYGKTKLAAEELLAAAVTAERVDGVVVRAFNHTGPRQLPRMMVPQWARQIVQGGPQPLRVFSRESHLDLTDARDVVRAYRLAAQEGTSGLVYNIGSGVCRRSGDVLDELLRVAETERQIIETSPDRRQNPIADVSRFAEQTGWQPEISLTTTLADTLAFWHLQPTQP